MRILVLSCWSVVIVTVSLSGKVSPFSFSIPDYRHLIANLCMSLVKSGDFLHISGPRN